jgi:hypothetical protein
MTLSFDEVQQVWAKKKFEERGRVVQEGDRFSIDTTVIYGGYCETCSYETSGYEIRNIRTRETVELEIYFSEFMRELEELSQEGTE